jgi:hypothetical protein
MVLPDWQLVAAVDFPSITGFLQDGKIVKPAY